MFATWELSTGFEFSLEVASYVVRPKRSMGLAISAQKTSPVCFK